MNFPFIYLLFPPLLIPIFILYARFPFYLSVYKSSLISSSPSLHNI